MKISDLSINTGNKFNGKVIVQRYFPARRAWRLFTAPLSGAGSIFDNWQNKGVYQAGVGTYVTGTGATNPTGTNTASNIRAIAITGPDISFIAFRVASFGDIFS